MLFQLAETGDPEFAKNLEDELLIPLLLKLVDGHVELHQDADNLPVSALVSAQIEQRRERTYCPSAQRYRSTAQYSPPVPQKVCPARSRACQTTPTAPW